MSPSDGIGNAYRDGGSFAQQLWAPMQYIWAHYGFNEDNWLSRLEGELDLSELEQNDSVFMIEAAMKEVPYESVDE